MCKVCFAQSICSEPCGVDFVSFSYTDLFIQLVMLVTIRSPIKFISYLLLSRAHLTSIQFCRLSYFEVFLSLREDRCIRMDDYLLGID